MKKQKAASHVELECGEASLENDRPELTPVVFEGEGRASVLMLVGAEVAALVKEAASGGFGRVFTATSYTDVLAIGCDLAVLDPALLSEPEWNCLCEVYGSYVDIEFRVLLVRASPFKMKLPVRNVLKPPAEMGVSFLRGTMIRAARRKEGRDDCEKRERQIVRLMHMLRLLDSGGLRVRDVAAHFEVSPRTIQRDLEVLAMAGYPIQDGAEPGAYVFPKGAKSYEIGVK